MGSICLSSASILRCSPLSELQNIALVIPPALEVIFSTSLILLNWNGTKRHLLLTAEGWVYLTLTVIELIRTIVPGVRDSVPMFQAFDVGLGVTSFLPIFFYTFFLYLLTSNDLVDALPRSIKNVAKLSLILFLPAIIVLNEVASFVGVKLPAPGTLTSSPNVKDPSQQVAVGFTNRSEESLQSFFTSTTLALLVVYQASVFSFSFFRLARAIIGQRSIEKDDADKAHFINGIGWLCIALKLGALESVIGFAGGSFGIALTRRIMRMMARGFLCIGIAKGVDTIEDFHDVQRELKLGSYNSRKKKSTIAGLISNPRSSTFRPLSPTAATFHANLSAKRASIGYIKTESELSKGPHYSTWSQRQSTLLQTGLPGMKAFANVKQAREKQRVTVFFDRGTPKLHMRFSSLDVFNSAISEKADSHPQSNTLGGYQGRTQVQLPYVSEYANSENDSELQAPAPQFYNERAGSDSYRDSINSAPSVGQFEIVDARKFSQKPAIAQLYRSPSGDTEPTASPVKDITFPEPTYQTPSQPERSSHIRGNAKTKSGISVADSIQAVRELTSQFPGPPGISQLRPAQNINRPLPDKTKATIQPATPVIMEKSVWEDDSRTSAQYLSGLPQVIGSPSQLSFNKDATIQWVQSSSVGADENVRSVMPSIDEASPVRAGKVAVTPGGYSRMSSASLRFKNRAQSMQKPFDPSSDDSDSWKPSKTPTYAPVGTPLRESLRLNTSGMPARQSGKGGTQPLSSADMETPSTALSHLTRLQSTTDDDRIDPFVDFATALDTGKSRHFRPSMPPLPVPAPRRRMSAIPTASPTRVMSKAEEKLSRIAQWVDTSANLAAAAADAEMPVTPNTIVTPTIVESPVDMKPDERPRENNLQNLHDRGPSIDALAIPWLKNPNMSEEDARRPGRAVVESSAIRPQLATRITTVGRAPSRTTPAPMQSAYMRGSLHLQPIIVPPRNGNLPEIEYESIESPVNRKVLKDSDVLDMEDSLSPPPRQSVRRL